MINPQAPMLLSYVLLDIASAYVVVSAGDFLSVLSVEPPILKQ